jgi:hypothetical protein
MMRQIIEAALKKVAGIELGYACKACGKMAYMHRGVLKRTCEHTGTVIALMDADMDQQGSVLADPK